MTMRPCVNCIGGRVLEEGDRAVCINCGHAARDDARMIGRVERALKDGFDLTRPSTVYTRKGPRRG